MDKDGMELFEGEMMNGEVMEMDQQMMKEENFSKNERKLSQKERLSFHMKEISP